MNISKLNLQKMIRSILSEQSSNFRAPQFVVDDAASKVQLSNMTEEVLYRLGRMKIPHTTQDVANHLKAVKNYEGDYHSGPDHHIATVKVSELSLREKRLVKKIGNYFGRGRVVSIQNGYVLLIETIPEDGGYIRFSALSEKIYGVPSGEYGGPLPLPDSIEVPGLMRLV